MPIQPELSQTLSTSLTLPPIPPSLALTPLFGHPPSTHLHTVYNLYASQIASILWTVEGENVPRRPVIVGVALKKAPSTASTDLPGEDDLELTDAERSLYMEVMKMVFSIVSSS
ncbi:hypothetical protein FRB99_006030 [Tulasnella sp. 403]|nr:hypothetical protein FRB99_006030 [Tulasnella sp. 403]